MILSFCTTACQGLTSNRARGKTFCNHIHQVHTGPYAWSIYGSSTTNVSFAQIGQLCYSVCTAFWRASIQAWKIFFAMPCLLTVNRVVFSSVRLLTKIHVSSSLTSSSSVTRRVLSLPVDFWRFTFALVTIAHVVLAFATLNRRLMSLSFPLAGIAMAFIDALCIVFVPLLFLSSPLP